MRYLSFPNLTAVSNQLDGLDLGDRILLTKIETYSCKQTHSDKKSYLSLLAKIQDSLASRSRKMNFNSLDSLLTTYNTENEPSSSNASGAEKSNFGSLATLNEISPKSNDQFQSLLHGTPNHTMDESIEPFENVQPNQSQQSNQPNQSNELNESDNSNTTIDPATLPPIPTPLGDLRNLSTQKLLCTLIMTLNAAYSDYDFSQLDPDSFEPVVNGTSFLGAINENVLLPADSIRPGLKRAVWEAIDEAIKISGCIVFSYLSDPDSPVFSLGKLWSCNYFFFNKELRRVLLFSCAARSKLVSPMLSARSGHWAEMDSLDLGGSSGSRLRANSRSRSRVQHMSHECSTDERVNRDDDDDDDDDDNDDDDDDLNNDADEYDEYSLDQGREISSSHHQHPMDLDDGEYSGPDDTLVEKIGMDSVTDEMASLQDHVESHRHHKRHHHSDAYDSMSSTSSISSVSMPATSVLTAVVDLDMVDWEGLGLDVVTLPGTVWLSPGLKPMRDSMDIGASSFSLSNPSGSGSGSSSGSNSGSGSVSGTTSNSGNSGSINPNDMFTQRVTSYGAL